MSFVNRELQLRATIQELLMVDELKGDISEDH